MSSEKEIGRLQSDVFTLKGNYKEMDAKLDKLIQVSDEQKGARKTLYFIYVCVIAVATLKFGDIKGFFGS